MIKLGKVYGNRMIDLSVSNDKLLDRAIGILFDIGSVDKVTAVRLLKKTNGSVKLSLLIALSGMDVIDAKQLLNDSKGNLRTALIRVKDNWIMFNLTLSIHILLSAINFKSSYYEKNLLELKSLNIPFGFKANWCTRRY